MSKTVLLGVELLHTKRELPEQEVSSATVSNARVQRIFGAAPLRCFFMVL
jgi:hypothetical protein